MKQFSLEEYLKNPSRKVVTRDGRNVTIHCTNYQGFFPIVAEIEGLNTSMAFTIDGVYGHIQGSNYDLFFALGKHEGWVNLYRDTRDVIYVGSMYTSEKEAKENIYSPPRYVTTIKIEWEE